MITRIEKFRNVGCYDEFDFDAGELKPFNKVNIVYGSNGCGKTTLTNVFYLLSKHCKDKSQLLSEILESDCEVEIYLDTSKITHRNIEYQDLDLYVFNSKFVSDHVFNGTCANLSQFGGEVKLTSPSIDAIDHSIKLWQNRKDWVGKLLKKITDKLETIFQVYNHEFQSKVSGYRLTNVKPKVEDDVQGVSLVTVKSELTELYTEYGRKGNQENILAKIDSAIGKLEKVQPIEINFEIAKSLLNDPISVTAREELAAKIASFQKFIDANNYTSKLPDLIDWFRKSGRLLKISKSQDAKCPTCNSDLTSNIDELLTIYTAYFTDELNKLQESIDQSLSKLYPFTNGDQIRHNQTIVTEVEEDCRAFFNLIPIGSAGIGGDESLLSALRESQAIFEQKRNHPNSSLALKADTQLLVEEYNKHLMIVLEKYKASLEIEKERLSRRSIDNIVKEIKEKISRATTLELNSDAHVILQSSRRSNAALAVKCSLIINELNSNLYRLGQERSSEVIKLNAESKYINLYLKHFGLDHFSVDTDKSKTEDNLVITYNVSGKKRTRLNHSLSEGEKTALAFSYFISKLRVEKLEGLNDGFKHSIIVIDDPISSLDDNRLFQTANIIDSFFFHAPEGEHFQPQQFFLFSHNLTFVKYIHNALRSNSSLSNSIEEYFLHIEKPKIRKLPSGLKNYTNTYILKLKAILDFKERRTDYETAKNYLPNYIRVVLETFLSFKLAIVNDGHNRLPGLNYLIGGMVEEFKKIDDVTIGDINQEGVIKRLNHLKKIADHESHGSIYRAEEFSFISEHELKLFAKYAVQVIEYIDNLHFKKMRTHIA